MSPDIEEKNVPDNSMINELAASEKRDLLKCTVVLLA